MKFKLFVDALYTDINGIDIIMEELKESLDFILNDEYRFENTYKYGYEYKEIIIKPFCVCRRFQFLLGWDDVIKINKKLKTAEVNFGILYERFVNETFENRRMMFIDIIIKSIEAIVQKSTHDFKGRILINDILMKLNVKYKDLLYINNRKSLI